MEGHRQKTMVNSCRNSARKDAPALLSVSRSAKCKAAHQTPGQRCSGTGGTGGMVSIKKKIRVVGKCLHTLFEWRGISWIWSWSREKAQRLPGLRLRILRVYRWVLQVPDDDYIRCVLATPGYLHHVGTWAHGCASRRSVFTSPTTQGLHSKHSSWSTV